MKFFYKLLALLQLRDEYLQKKADYGDDFDQSIVGMLLSVIEEEIEDMYIKLQPSNDLREIITLAINDALAISKKALKSG